MTYDSLHKRLRGPMVKALGDELKVKNILALPRLDKVVVNVGINKSKLDSKEMQKYIGDSLAKITGQKPVFTRAKKAISNFKVREGMIVGAKVTLRGEHMEQFLDRFFSYSLPRVRDFRGLTNKLDGHGNYTIGIRDHSIFPEVPAPDAKQIFGMEVVITTTADNDEHALALFKQIGVPFKPEKKNEEKKVEKEEADAEAKKAAEEAAVEEAKPSEEKNEGKDENDGKEAKDDASSESSDSPKKEKEDKKSDSQSKS